MRHVFCVSDFAKKIGYKIFSIGNITHVATIQNISEYVSVGCRQYMSISEARTLSLSLVLGFLSSHRDALWTFYSDPRPQQHNKSPSDWSWSTIHLPGPRSGMDAVRRNGPLVTSKDSICHMIILDYIWFTLYRFWYIYILCAWTSSSSSLQRNHPNTQVTLKESQVWQKSLGLLVKGQTARPHFQKDLHFLLAKAPE